MGVGPCRLGRLHRDGRRVLCFADWSKEYGVPAWTSRNGFVKDVNFCRLYCEKRPDMVKVELEAKEKARCGNTGPNIKPTQWVNYDGIFAESQ